MGTVPQSNMDEGVRQLLWLGGFLAILLLWIAGLLCFSICVRPMAQHYYAAKIQTDHV